MTGAILTAIGKAKIASATPEDQLQITHVAVGDGNGSYPVLTEDMIALTNEVWRGDSSNPIRDAAATNTLMFESAIPPDVGGFTIREIAIFDVDGDMIAIGHVNPAQIKPLPTSETAVNMTVRMIIALANAEQTNLVLQIAPIATHNGLADRDMPGAHPAEAISYRLGSLAAFLDGLQNPEKTGIDASKVITLNGKTQEQVNGELKNRALNLLDFPRLADETHDTPRINRMITKANELGIRYCDIDDGDYYILASTSDTSYFGWDDGIELKSGVYVRASKGANIRALAYSYQGGTVMRAKSQYDIGWFGGKFFGERNQHLAPDGSAYVQRQNSAAYTQGQYIWYQSWGFLVTTGGTTAAAMPSYSSLNVGDSLTDGSATLQVVSKTLGEWGHNIAIYGCDRVFIDTESVDAWGDGCLITSTQVNSGTPSSNVFLRLKADNNRRQGLSVTSCDGLYILDGTELTNTNGVAPSAGVDFEPNANMAVKSVFIQTLICDNNDGGGFLAYANATGSKIENINAHTVIARNNVSAGFRARYANIDGIRIGNLTTQGNKTIAGVRVDGDAKNIQINEHVSDGDYVGISLSGALNIVIGKSVIKNSTYSNSSFTNVVGGEIGTIEDQNTSLNRGFELFSCSDLTIGKIKTTGSNNAGIYINDTHNCEIGFNVNCVKASHPVHLRGSNNNVISGIVGDQALTQSGSYGIYVDTTSTGNKINHNIVKAQTASKFITGIFCVSTTSGNTVMFNEVDANAHTGGAVWDSGSNTLELNSGQFAPDIQSATTAQLQSATHVVNVKYKKAGRTVMNTTTSKLYFAIGALANSPWRPIGAADGTQDITPA